MNKYCTTKRLLVLPLFASYEQKYLFGGEEIQMLFLRPATFLDLAEWLKHLTANAKVATVLGSIPASSDTVESERQKMKQCWIQHIKTPKMDEQILHNKSVLVLPLLASWPITKIDGLVRASDSQCQSRNCPGYDPSILRHSRFWGAADETVLNTIHKKIKLDEQILYNKEITCSTFVCIMNKNINSGEKKYKCFFLIS